MTEWFLSSAVLAAVLILLRRLLRGRLKPGVQYALWAILLVRLLVPVSLGSSSFSVTNLIPQQQTEQDVSTVIPPAAQTVPAISDREPVPEDVVVEVTELPTLEPPVVHRAPSLQAFWMMGAVGLGLWLLLVNFHFGRRLRRSRKPLAVADCPLPVYVSQEVQTPCLFGLLRPSVYVTREAADDPVVLGHALAHELTHYRHGDHIWAVLRSVCLAFHWFDPLVWYAALLSKRDGELACDEGTIRRLGEEQRAAYGRTLIALTCERRPDLWLTATTMTGSSKEIRERIMTIAKKPRMPLTALAMALLLALGAVGCTFTGPAESETPSTQPDVTPSIQPEETPSAAISGPAEALAALWEPEQSLVVSLYLANEGAMNGYVTEDPYHLGRYQFLLDGFTWEEVQAPPPVPGQFWLTLKGADPDREDTMTIWDGAPAVVQYNSRCWQGQKKDDVPDLGTDMRMEYDNLEVDFRHIMVEAVGPEQAAERFVHQAYGAHMMGLAPGNMYRFVSYDVVRWELMAISEDRTAVIGRFTSAFEPEDPDSSGIWAGNTYEGEGAYAGKLQFYREFALQLQADGSWHCVEFGTGGIGLPERPEVVGAVYCYRGEGFGGDFTLSLRSDGSFEAYEGMLSSTVLVGTWTKEGDLLTLTDQGPQSAVYHFRREDDALVFQAEGSDSFLFVDVQDGDVFDLYSGV